MVHWEWNSLNLKLPLVRGRQEAPIDQQEARQSDDAAVFRLRRLVRITPERVVVTDAVQEIMG